MIQFVPFKKQPTGCFKLCVPPNRLCPPYVEVPETHVRIVKSAGGDLSVIVKTAPTNLLGAPARIEAFLVKSADGGGVKGAVRVSFTDVNPSEKKGGSLEFQVG